MKRLPDFFIGRWFASWQARRYLRKHLSIVPDTENFCVVRIRTSARIHPNTLERARWVAYIPTTTRHTSWSALERAVAILSEEAARLGWHFHMPVKRTPLEGCLHAREEIRAECKDAVDELLRVVDEEDAKDLGFADYMHDIGAKGRRAVYLSWAKRPAGYVLGVRVEIEKRQTR